MQNLVGRAVKITEVSYATADREGVPFEFVYEGMVAEVDGHMIKVVNCRIKSQPYSFPHPAMRWFNTMASTFKSIDETK